MAKSGKGSTFERGTCKELSLWFSRDKRDDIFWRTAGSGARATVRAKQNLMTADSAGDICAIHPSGKVLTRMCIVELKKGYTGKSPSKRASLMSFIDKLPSEKEPLILRWAKKAEGECKTHKRKFWFIIFQRDRKKSVICMLNKTFKYIDRRNPHKYKWPPFGPRCKMYIKDGEFLFMLLSDFLQWCQPESIPRKFPCKSKAISIRKFKQIINNNSLSTNNKRKIKRRK